MKILQLPVIGNGGRMGNHLFTIASTIGIALRNGYTPRFPADWKYRDRFNIPDEWFGEIVPSNYPITENAYIYQDFHLFSDIATIQGYLQSPKYWKGYEDLIRQYLTPKEAKPGTKEGVAIHYRRGDYVDNPNYFQLPALTSTLSMLGRSLASHFNASLISLPVNTCVAFILSARFCISS